MLKKRVFFLILIAVGHVCAIYAKKPSNASYCAFCDSAVLNAQKFYEDDIVYALYTHKPIFPGHCLIIPKRHVERFEMLSEEEGMMMNQLIKKVNRASSQVFKTSSYLLLQKNGHEVGQTVPHVHFHYIPRQTEDDSTFKFLFHMFLANARKPISQQEMDQIVDKLKVSLLENDSP